MFALLPWSPARKSPLSHCRYEPEKTSNLCLAFLLFVHFLRKPTQHQKPVSSNEEKNVYLTTSSFKDGIDKYIEKFKPDPLEKKQLEALSLNWLQHDGRTSSGSADFIPILQCVTTYGESGISFPSFKEKKSLAKYRISGVLTLSGEHLCVSIEVECRWDSRLGKWHPFYMDSAAKHSEKSILNNFYFTLKASATLKTINNEDRRKKDLMAKIQNRLASDPCIRKLLHTSSPPANSKVAPAPMTVCEVSIYRVTENSHITTATPNTQTSKVYQMEERVDVSDDALKSIHKSLFSQMESTICVMELFVEMPWLPKSPLSDRASLKLLEDSMVDECVKVGEDEIIEDLKISDKKTDDDKGLRSRKRVQNGPFRKKNRKG